MAMKLKCEFSPLRNGGHSMGFNDGDREHDALAAHALMQAMEEFGPEGYVCEVQERADSILREWGFNSGEEAE